MAVKRINHKGIQILYTDFGNLIKLDEQLQLLEELVTVLKASPVKVLILSNFEGASLGPEFMNRSKEVGKQNQNKISRHAFLGITGLKNILFQGYAKFTAAKNIKSFSNEVDALDWLVS